MKERDIKFLKVISLIIAIFSTIFLFVNLEDLSNGSIKVLLGIISAFMGTFSIIQNKTIKNLENKPSIVQVAKLINKC